jgi:VanZ family protein
MNDRMGHLRWRALWLALGACIVVAIGVGSLSPIQELPKVPGTDKSHHFIAYGTLMYWFAQITAPRWRTATLAILFGISMEILQPIVANRFFEWLDILANTTGVALGWFLAITPLGALVEKLDAALSARGRG